jgi:hypothetical protein
MASHTVLHRLWQAKVPLLMAAVVVLLVVATLRANDERECRQVCLKERFIDGVYARETFAGGECRCVTADRTLVPAPPPPAGR